MGWVCEADPGTFWGACLTELILTWEQDFLAHWATEHLVQGEEPRPLFSWAQTELPLWSSSKQTCALETPFMHIKRSKQPAGSGHPLHMAPYAQTFGTDSDISFKPHCWQSSAPHCDQERMIPGPYLKGRDMQKCKCNLGCYWQT